MGRRHQKFWKFDSKDDANKMKKVAECVNLFYSLMTDD